MTMTISEALNQLKELAGYRGGATDREAWNVIRSRLEVTDEMAQRAIDEWFNTGFRFDGRHIPRMKAALVAALGE